MAREAKAPVDLDTVAGNAQMGKLDIDTKIVEGVPMEYLKVPLIIMEPTDLQIKEIARLQRRGLEINFKLAAVQMELPGVD